MVAGWGASELGSRCGTVTTGLLADDTRPRCRATCPKEHDLFGNANRGPRILPQSVTTNFSRDVPNEITISVTIGRLQTCVRSVWSRRLKNISGQTRRVVTRFSGHAKIVVTRNSGHARIVVTRANLVVTRNRIVGFNNKVPRNGSVSLERYVADLRKTPCCSLLCCNLLRAAPPVRAY